ncbi:MAG: FKBP-type peptidyl-prolyl cis-trans isomerase [Gammaproteobacteria bacterium]
MTARNVLPMAICLAFVTPVYAEKDVTISSEREKLSYAIGIQVGQTLMRQGVELDTRAFSLAVEDTVAGRAPRLDEAERRAVLQRQAEIVQQTQVKKAGENLAAGKAFLAENKKKKGVQELPSGLQYKVVKDGEGAQPKPTDTVKVNYRGTLTDGTEFDSSERAGGPVQVQLNGVIKGWQEALALMKEGAKWQIFVPPDLAYGDRGTGSTIEPNQVLIFEVELLAVNPKS